MGNHYDPRDDDEDRRTAQLALGATPSADQEIGFESLDGHDPESSLDPVVAFLYLVLRDHLPAGVVEQCVKDVQPIRLHRLEGVFSNPHLATYAKSIAARLRKL